MDECFIGKVLHKHVLARNYFSKLPGMAQHLQSSLSHDLVGLSLAPTSTNIESVIIKQTLIF